MCLKPIYTSNPVLPGAQGKPKYMLIETKNKGGGDGGGEDFSLGAWSAAECPKAMPCGDCGEKCNQNAYNFKICQYDDKQVNCIGGGVWYYAKEDQERSSI